MQVVAALIGSVVTFGENMRYNKKEKNESAQQLEQFSEIEEQLAECASENNTIASCNNFGLELNLQGGNNSAAGQQ